jgi:hypothetical protein
MSLHWGWVWCGDLRAGLNQKLSDSLRLARRCVKCVMAQCSACPHEMGCGARVSEAQHFRCRAVHSKASKAARQAGTTDSGDCTSVETRGFAQSVRRSGSGGLLHFSPARVPPSDMGMGRGRGRVRVGILRSRRCDRQEAERAHYLFQNKTEGGQTGPLSISNLSPDLARTPLLTAALVLGTLSTVYT